MWQRAVHNSEYQAPSLRLPLRLFVQSQSGAALPETVSGQSQQQLYSQDSGKKRLDDCSVQIQAFVHGLYWNQQ